MPARSPARFVAPIALVAFTAVAIAIATSSSSTSNSSKPATPSRPVHHAPRHSVVIVHTGDSLSRIAVRNGVSVVRIEQLNPQLNPNALRVGQRLKLVP
jgi:LysM repeat protein